MEFFGIEDLFIIESSYLSFPFFPLFYQGNFIVVVLISLTVVPLVSPSYRNKIFYILWEYGFYSQ